MRHDSSNVQTLRRRRAREMLTDLLLSFELDGDRIAVVHVRSLMFRLDKILFARTP